MRKILLASSFVVLTLIAGLARAEPAGNVFHYACTQGDERYALTVNENRGIVKLLNRAAPYKLTTFRIVTNVIPDCGKGGWTLNDGAVFCYATQGAGTLVWHGHDYNCDQADTE
jgi:hypothetical protein